MTRLTWRADARYYEQGIDRGVLYVDGQPGVAWNGIVAITENTVRGEAVPSYHNGYKYRNRTKGEEFEATIDAFSSPKEFDLCDGTVPAFAGLKLTQQPRKKFHLVYRTSIGNAVLGKATHYKIHLVYNASAIPSARTNNTLSDSEEANSLSWDITTRAPKITGYRPTAHVIIDSRFVPPETLILIEDILYGDEDTEPRILFPEELFLIFEDSDDQYDTLPVDGEFPWSTYGEVYDGEFPDTPRTNFLEGGFA